MYIHRMRKYFFRNNTIVINKKKRWDHAEKNFSKAIEIKVVLI